MTLNLDVLVSLSGNSVTIIKEDLEYFLDHNISDTQWKFFINRLQDNYGIANESFIDLSNILALENEDTLSFKREYLMYWFAKSYNVYNLAGLKSQNFYLN